MILVCCGHTTNKKYNDKYLSYRIQYIRVYIYILPILKHIFYKLYHIIGILGKRNYYVSTKTIFSALNDLTYE